MNRETAKPLQLRLPVQEDGLSAIELLAGASGLSRARLKDAMNKGAVWRQGPRGARKRLRRATTRLQRGDLLSLYYDPKLLERQAPEPLCVLDQRRYSVWDKPAGMMSQGNEYGDHCSLLRHAERHFTPPREVFLVHRLDREASGLVLLAHDKKAAALFSALFQGKQVYKRYRVEVLGDLSNPGDGRIEAPLDGKPAQTRYRCVAYDAARHASLLDVEIETGRLHQVRRHLDSIGHPVLGDPRYGSGNKNTSGMCLRAVELRFPCPVTRREMRVVVE
jgi:tRNA pseudouridine32 synthase/23S rRNA pseudouridine746 synthase